LAISLYRQVRNANHFTSFELRNSIGRLTHDASARLSQHLQSQSPVSVPWTCWRASYSSGWSHRSRSSAIVLQPKIIQVR